MLTLTKLRELRLEAPSARGRPRHLSAASGLVRAGAFLYVVADDELHLGVFPVTGEAPGRLLRLLPGGLPGPPAARKAQKPDFEALALMAQAPGLPGAALLALGSASTPARERGALVALDADGGIAGAPVPLDLAPLAAALREALGRVNLEGAVVRGDRLVLLQRAQRGGEPNALVAVPLSAALAPGAPIRAEVRPVDLGAVAGVPLGFTDATPLPDGSLAFSAIAEDTPNSYDDGPCVGAAVGIVDPRGELRRLERLVLPAKIEGIAARADAGGLELLLVTDADDANVPATLNAARLPGYPSR
jgi:hypothetical protein